MKHSNHHDEQQQQRRRVRIKRNNNTKTRQWIILSIFFFSFFFLTTSTSSTLPTICTAAAFVVTTTTKITLSNHHHLFTSQPPSTHTRISHISSSSTDTATTTTSTTKMTEASLKQMTVKDLKSYIKENNYMEKGLSSKLKLKADIINFILQKQTQDQDQEEEITLKQQPQEKQLTTPPVNNGKVEMTNGKVAAATAATKMKKGLQMPRLDILQETTTTTTPPIPQNNTAAAATTTTVNNNNNNNRKNKLFELVLKRYPPLQLLYDAQTSLVTPSSPTTTDEEKKEEMINTEQQPTVNNASSPPDKEVNENQLYSLQQEYLTAQPFTGLGELDIRQKYHPLLKDAPTSADMDVVFVGTASCTPGVTRGVSCTALRLNWKRSRAILSNGGASDGKEGKEKKGKKGGKQKQQQKQVVEEYSAFNGGTWLFDCGESTQLQIQRTGSVRPSKITKIFVTHAHGDHSFGLPGLLCLMGQDRPRDGPPVDIYGPEGLRMWLRVAMRYSVSRICPAYRVHEIMDVPMAPEWDLGRFKGGRYYYQLFKEGKKGEPWGVKGLAGEDPHSWISRAPLIHLEPSARFGEVEGGRDIFPLYDHPACVDGAPIWEIEDEGDVRVFAAPMSHGVPCVGYVVEEQSRPGRLRNELVEPIVRKNIDALRQNGFKIPMKVMAVIKNLPEGGSFTFPDGTVLTQDEAVEPERTGRKVVICGDTADARAIAGLAQDADVVIHEATNTYLKGIDKDTNLETVTKDAKIHGHSTPQMAGDFAAKVGAKKLLLNHFSARYKGDQSLDSISIMTRMEQLAIKASKLPEDCVGASWDFMILPIPQN